MAGRIRDVDIALVRERSPIADVIGEHIQLRNAGGGNLKGLCPFHDEKSPSFNVTPERGMYFCFGCGEGGDVITFVMKRNNLTFAEAVQRLAKRAGVELANAAEQDPAPVPFGWSSLWADLKYPPTAALLIVSSLYLAASVIALIVEIA